MRILVLALLGLIAFSGNARCWGDTGHQVVCEIAFRLAATTPEPELDGS
jgi:hypothetical protein